MSPEVIRNEICSEKIDVWSYGVVLWELITCEMPYKNLDSSAIIWGIGNHSLELPIPSTCPEGFQLLIKQCWNLKPKNRPSFKIILSHLEIAGAELLHRFTENYEDRQKTWKQEVNDKLLACAQNSVKVYEYEKELIRKRTDEWRHAKDVRMIYEKKLERTNNLYLELNECFTKLEEREREILEREKNIGLNYPQRSALSQFKKQHFEKWNRKKFAIVAKKCNSSTSTTPSPSMILSKSALFVEIDGNKVNTTAVNQNVNETGSQMKKVPTVPSKKTRHKRASSGSFHMRNSPRKFVDIETQTEVGENSAAEQQQHQSQKQPAANDINKNSVMKKSISSSSGESDIDDYAPREDTTSSSQTNHLNMTTSMATSIMTCSNLTYDNDDDDDDLHHKDSDGDLEDLRQKVSSLVTNTSNSSISSNATILNTKIDFKKTFDENMNDSKDFNDFALVYDEKNINTNYVAGRR
jgi:mitogen-activated protein kinase kinase kinase 13